MSVVGLLALAIVSVAGDEKPLGLLANPSWVSMISASSNAEVLRTNDDPTVCNSIYSCQDCHTARICKPTTNGSFELLQTIPCSGSRPFCEPVSGSCVAEEPDSCGQPDNFVCLGNGRYPDTNCSIFHACLNLQSVSFICSQGRVYNARSQVCEEGLDCGTFDCVGLDGSKIPHSVYKGYYAYCHNGNGPLVVDSCPGNYELNTTSQLCEPICHANGIQADASDCHFYYKCSKITINPDTTYFERERLKCPESQAYSTKDYLCVDEKQVESCQNP